MLRRKKKVKFTLQKYLFSPYCFLRIISPPLYPPLPLPWGNTCMLKENPEQGKIQMGEEAGAPVWGGCV